jgi:hypothetical protein
LSSCCNHGTLEKSNSKELSHTEKKEKRNKKDERKQQEEEVGRKVTSKEGIHPYLVGKAAAATSSPLPLLLSRSWQQVHRHDVKLRPPFYI